MALLLTEKGLKRHAITTYDFEWKKGEFEGDRAPLDFIMAGAYDERGYRDYRSLEEFVARELVTENAGRRYYAHFGGASDMVFLLRVLASRKHWSIKALFSSSSAIVVRVEDGKRCWTFLDSFWTMRVGLKTIGDWLGSGNAKGEMDHTKEHPYSVWKEYNEQDCRILWRALTDFQEIVNDRGCELRVTGASTALDMIQRRYLQRPIRNMDRINDYVRPAYVSSKVQKYRDTCERATVYDINSSFPYSMTFPLPGDLLAERSSIPSGGLWCADVDVIVPEQYNPPLPWRHPEEGRIYFPTGKFRTRLTSEDLLCGDFEIAKVHSCWTFEERLDLAEFANDLFALRQGGGFQAQVWKIIVNSGYGKFAERADKEVLYINPKSYHPSMQAIAPHIYLGTETAEIEHCHVPFSAFITARSRRFLREHENSCLASASLYYSDCDSVITDAVLSCGKELGALKEEARILEGFFEGAKLYAYRKDDGKEVAKAKGFSRVVSEGGSGEQRLSYQDLANLGEGEALRVERMRRLKEHIREAKGFDFTPDVVRLNKQLRFPRPKREGLPDGNSRPWSVEALAA